MYKFQIYINIKLLMNMQIKANIYNKLLLKEDKIKDLILKLKPRKKSMIKT